MQDGESKKLTELGKTCDRQFKIAEDGSIFFMTKSEIEEKKLADPNKSSESWFHDAKTNKPMKQEIVWLRLGYMTIEERIVYS